MPRPLSLALVLASVSISPCAVAQLQPGDRVLVGHYGNPASPRILITDPSFASQLFELTGMTRGWTRGAVYDAATGRFFILSDDVYSVQIAGSSAVATRYGYATYSEPTIFIGHNGEPVVVRESGPVRHALYEVSQSTTRQLFGAQQIGDQICGATYDPLSRTYFLHTTPSQFPASPQIWKVSPAGHAEILVANFPWCYDHHTDLVADGRGGVYVSNTSASGILHVSSSGVVQQAIAPPVNQRLSAAGIERDRFYVYDGTTTTFLVDLVTSQIVPQWGNLTAFQGGALTALFVVLEPCRGSAARFGTGCADHSSTVLDLFTAGCATPGAAIGLHLQMGYVAPYFLLAGLSNTAWQGAPLPFALGPLGGGTCAVLTSSDLFLGPFENARSVAAFPVPLARDPALIGGAFYVQGGTLDPTANALGIAISNGVAIAIG